MGRGLGLRVRGGATDGPPYFLSALSWVQKDFLNFEGNYILKRFLKLNLKKHSALKIELCTVHAEIAIKFPAL